ncbi:Nudix hydrolase 12 mitochondrial [Bienertia sinuspersici]
MRRRYEDCECSIEDCLEVLMVSSPSCHDLIVPKGGWENDETIHEATCREAFEEAGFRGNINVFWEFRSKSRQAIIIKKNSIEGGCRGQMFALEVLRNSKLGPDKKTTVKYGDAFKLCRYEWMKDALRAFIERMDKERDSNVTINAMILPERQVAKATLANRAIISTAIIAIAFALVAP